MLKIKFWPPDGPWISNFCHLIAKYFHYLAFGFGCQSFRLNNHFFLNVLFKNKYRLLSLSWALKKIGLRNANQFLTKSCENLNFFLMTFVIAILIPNSHCFGQLWKCSFGHSLLPTPFSLVLIIAVTNLMSQSLVLLLLMTSQAAAWQLS